MRTRNLNFLEIAQIRARARRAGYQVDHAANWYRCMTCLREIDSIRIADHNDSLSNGYVDVVATCHGAEESVRIHVPQGTKRDEHINQAAKAHLWFDPTLVPK